MVQLDQNNIGRQSESSADALVRSEFGPCCREVLFWGGLSLASGIGTYFAFSRGDKGLGWAGAVLAGIAAGYANEFRDLAIEELRGRQRNEGSSGK
jgi:hypothetical protein